MDLMGNLNIPTVPVSQVQSQAIENLQDLALSKASDSESNASFEQALKKVEEDALPLITMIQQPQWIAPKEEVPTSGSPVNLAQSVVVQMPQPTLIPREVISEEAPVKAASMEVAAGKEPVPKTSKPDLKVADGLVPSQVLADGISPKPSIRTNAELEKAGPKIEGKAPAAVSPELEQLLASLPHLQGKAPSQGSHSNAVITNPEARPMEIARQQEVPLSALKELQGLYQAESMPVAILAQPNPKSEGRPSGPIKSPMGGMEFLKAMDQSRSVRDTVEPLPLTKGIPAKEFLAQNYLPGNSAGTQEIGILQDRSKKEFLPVEDVLSPTAQAIQAQHSLATEGGINPVRPAPSEVVGHVVQGSMAQNRLSSESLMNLGQEIRQVAGTGGGEVHIRLKPESLGEVSLKVTTFGNRVGLRITAADEGSRKILEESLSSLTEKLASQNLVLSKVDFHVTPSSAPMPDRQDFMGSLGDHSNNSWNQPSGQQERERQGHQGLRQESKEYLTKGHSERKVATPLLNQRLDVIA